SAAFFAPEIGMVPLSFRPPVIRMRSITNSYRYGLQIIGLTGLRQKQRNFAAIMGLCPNRIVIPGHAQAWTSGVQLHIGESRDSGFSPVGLLRNDVVSFPLWGRDVSSGERGRG